MFYRCYLTRIFGNRSLITIVDHCFCARDLSVMNRIQYYEETFSSLL